MPRRDDLMCSLPEASGYEAKQFENLLRSSKDEDVRALADDAKLIKITTSLLKGIVDITKGDPASMISGYSGVVSSTANGVAAASKNSQAAQLTAFTIGQFARTLSAVKINGSPGSVGAKVALMFSQKTLLTLGLMSNDEQSKLRLAYVGAFVQMASLGLAIGTGAGAVILTLEGVALAAQLLEVYSREQTAP